MKLWERSAAFALLDEMLRDSVSVGRVALVAGEAGIGKSALLAAFAARSAGRAHVLWGTCDPLVTPRALGPLHDIGRQAGGVLAARLAAGAAQAELFDALIGQLSGPRQRPRPVIVIEDIHWADEATLDLIVYLSRRIDRLAVLLVVTYRDDEVSAEHPVRTALAAMPAHVVRGVPVPHLSRECVAEQARLAGRDPAEMYELTGGNPLLLTELLAADDGAAVPGTVRDLILARLRGLPSPARRLAHLVAVMPTRADPVVYGGMEDQVDRCIAAGVLAPSGGDGVAYRHELLRRAVEDSLSPARRTALHRTALAKLAGVPGVDPARLAHHARLAADVQAMLRHGLAAASSAAVQGAHREAVAQYRAVLPHAGRLLPHARAEVLEQFAFQAYLTGFIPEGLDVLRGALVIRERLGDVQRVGADLRWLSRLAWSCGRGAEARAAARKAVEVLRAGEPGHELAMAYSTLSQLHMLANENSAAIEWGERAVELGRSLNDREVLAHASVNLGTARLHAGDPQAPAALRRAHALASGAGLLDHAARALVNLASTLCASGDCEAGSAAVDEAIAYTEAEVLDAYMAYLLGIRASVRVDQCRWDEAMADAETALSLPNHHGGAAISPLVARGRILAARGERAVALSILDEAAEIAEGTGEIQRIGPVASARSEFFLWYGDTARAIAEARLGLRLAADKDDVGAVGELSYRLWRAGDPAVEPPGVPTPYGMVMRGDWAGAAAEWKRRGNEYARCEALSAGDRVAADEALRILDGLGAIQAAQRLRAELRRRGITGVARGPRRPAVPNAAGLTPRQLEVLRLLADGLTNADIAARLVLSPKTVEHHVSAVLGKLDVQTRGQAVAAGRRLDLSLRDR